MNLKGLLIGYGVASAHAKSVIGVPLTSVDNLQAYIRQLIGVNTRETVIIVTPEDKPDLPDDDGATPDPASPDAPVVLSPASFTMGRKLRQAASGGGGIYDRTLTINEAVDPLDWIVVNITYAYGQAYNNNQVVTYNVTLQGTGQQWKAGMVVPNLSLATDRSGASGFFAYGHYAQTYNGAVSQTDYSKLGYAYVWNAQMPLFGLLRDVQVLAARVYRGVY